jgi:hypothetical protein
MAAVLARHDHLAPQILRRSGDIFCGVNRPSPLIVDLVPLDPSTREEIAFRFFPDFRFEAAAARHLS